MATRCAGGGRTKDTVLIGPGERYDIELTGSNPGVWMFHCHMENHADNGMMTLIQYEGERPTGPVAEFFDPERGSPAGHMVHHPVPTDDGLPTVSRAGHRASICVAHPGGRDWRCDGDRAPRRPIRRP